MATVTNIRSQIDNRLNEYRKVYGSLEGFTLGLSMEAYDELAGLCQGAVFNKYKGIDVVVCVGQGFYVYTPDEIPSQAFEPGELVRYA